MNNVAAEFQLLWCGFTLEIISVASLNLEQLKAFLLSLS